MTIYCTKYCMFAYVNNKIPDIATIKKCGLPKFLFLWGDCDLDNLLL